MRSASLKDRTRLDGIFLQAIKQHASDVHLQADAPPVLRIDGELAPIKNEPLISRDELETMVTNLLSDEQKKTFATTSDIDISYEMADLTRFRINLYREKDGPALAARLIPSKLPTMEELHAPPIMFQFAELAQGLILVTGPTGCGKSTTLAAMIEYINENRCENIITLEDPIEFLYKPKQCLISQRQLDADMTSFPSALKHVLRQDPNVILVGEMRDPETIATTVTLAETGHLVFATLHTNDAVQTIDRIIDVFPSHQQQQIRLQLSFVLKGVISQLLLPKVGGGRIAAREILVQTTAISNLIRENKTLQINSYLATKKDIGMQSMDQDIRRLFDEKQIDEETALFFTREPNLYERTDGKRSRFD